MIIKNTTKGVHHYSLNCSHSSFKPIRPGMARIENPPLVIGIDLADRSIFAAKTEADFKKEIRGLDGYRTGIQSFLCRFHSYAYLDFQYGIEYEQQVTSARDALGKDTLILSATGLIKLCEAFDGKLQKFLLGNALNSAAQFFETVAPRIAQGQDPETVEGSYVSHTIRKLATDEGVQCLLNRAALDAFLGRIAR